MVLLITQLQLLKQKTRVSYPIYHINKSFLLHVQVTLRKLSTCLLMHLVYCLQYLFWTKKKISSVPLRFQALLQIAGTERGITEPVPSFSPGFGEAFLTLHPTVYAKTLIGKAKNTVQKFAVNTGWNRTGKRISLKNTRAIIDAIIDGFN